MPCDALATADVPMRHFGYRRGVHFIKDIGQHSSLLDRNQKARLLHALEAFERASKRAGCQNGVITRPALAVMRVLLLRFHNAGSGHCFPSYEALQKATGFCRATIAKSLRILEAVGVLKITRRLLRVRDGAGRLHCQQGSNLYAFAELPRIAFLPRSEAKPRPRFGLRVHAMGRNHNPTAKIDAEEVDEVALRREIAEKLASQPQDWRSRARRAAGF